MKRYRLFFIVLPLVFGLSACEIFQQVADQLPTTTSGSNPLSEQEVISGLKEALKVSTDTAVSVVSKTDGFFKNQAIKILLPPEAKTIMDNKDNSMLKAIGITKLIDDVILRMNRSAESAAKQATPIFVNAIKAMSIQDAFGILRGADNAATEYFKQKTSGDLFNAFKPTIKQALDKPLVANVSTTKSWNTLTSKYNKIAPLINKPKVNTDLVNYVTQKAIDGLFVKLAEQEKKIRKDPVARVTDILKRVFGGNN